MNHWSHTWCANDCGVVVWQYEPGGTRFERPEGQPEQEHKCQLLADPWPDWE